MTDNRMNKNATAGIDLTHAARQAEAMIESILPKDWKLKGITYSRVDATDWWGILIRNHEWRRFYFADYTLAEAVEKARAFVVDTAMDDINNPERMEV